MASFFQGIFQNVMNPGTNQGSGGTLTSGGIGAQASTMPTGASASSAAGTMGNIGGGVDSSALDSGTLDLSALPDQCQQVEDTIEPLRAALEKISKRADKCLVRKQPEEALQDAFHQSALSMRTRSNLFDCVLNGLAVTETELMQRREDLNEEITKWSAGLRDRERRLVDLQQQRRSLTRLASDLTKLRRRLGHAMQKQQASSGGGGGGGGSDAVGELQLEVSTRENEERKERDAYIVQLNSLQGEKPAHCQQLLQLMQARLNYHKNCLGHLEKQLPYLQAEVSRITKLSGPCYGTPLGDHLARTGRRIAYVIDVCTAALRRDDIMDEEGLFRVNGPTSSVQKLESFLDVMQAETEISRYDSASICGALKKYLKQLPEPLIGQSLLPDWKKACAFASSDERRMALHSCCSELHRRQPQYYENLRHLIKFLSLVCDRQERNKMSPKNLGICIGPNIVGTVAQQLQGAATLPANGSSATLTGIPGSTTASAPNYDDLHSANLGTLIVENLIVHQEFCFGSEDPTPLPVAPVGSLSHRSQQQHPLRRDSERSLGAASFASSSTAGVGAADPGTPTNFGAFDSSATNSSSGGQKFSTKSFHTDLYDTAFTLHALRSNGVAAAADAAAGASSVPAASVSSGPSQSSSQQQPRLDRSLGRLDRPLQPLPVNPNLAAVVGSSGTASHDFVKQARSIFEGHLLKSASLGASSSTNSASGGVDSPRLTRFKDLRSPPSDFAANNQQRLRSMSNLNSSNLCTTPFEPKFMNLPSNLSIPPAQSPTSAEAPCVGAVAMPTQASNDFQQQHQLLQQHSLSVSTTTIGDGSEAAAAASSARSADTRSHSGSVGGGTQHTQTPQQQQQLLQSPVRHRKPQAPLPPQQQQQQQQQQSSTISSRSHVREPSIGGQSSTGSVDSSSSTFLPSGQSAAAAATTASTTAIKRMGHSTFSAVDSNEVTNF